MGEIAEAGRAHSPAEAAAHHPTRAGALFASGLTFFLRLTMYWIGQPTAKLGGRDSRGIQILRADGTSTRPYRGGGGWERAPSSPRTARTTTPSRTTIRREFHDDQVYQLPDYTTNAPKGLWDPVQHAAQDPGEPPPDTTRSSSRSCTRSTRSLRELPVRDQQVHRDGGHP